MIKKFPHLITPAEYRRLGLKLEGVENPEALFEGPFAIRGAQVSGLGGTGAPSSGFNEAGDIFTATIDGINLGDLWAEFQETLNMHNVYRTQLIQYLSTAVTNIVEPWWQSIPDDAMFEEATEYGEPVAIRTPEPRLRGYPLRYYDLAIRYTWRYLAEADSAQVRALNNSALEKDLRLQYQVIMQALFNNVNGNVQLGNILNSSGAAVAGSTIPVHRLWNADGEVPPRWKTYVHDDTHTHYLVSGGAAVVPANLETIEDHLLHHGYFEAGRTFVLLVNRAQSKVIQGFRAGTGGATWDFIPAAATAWRGQLVGPAPSPGGITDGWVGSYGHLLVHEEDIIPAGYMLGVASGGPDSPTNLVGVREHPNPAVRGLKLLQGSQHDYPLVGSFYHHAMGAGVADRGSGIVMQVKASGDYSVPTWL